MDRRLVGGKDSFDIIQSVSDQSVQGSQAGKGRHGWAHKTRGEEENGNRRNELGPILSYIHDGQTGETRKGNSLGQTESQDLLNVSCLCSLTRDGFVVPRIATKGGRPAVAPITQHFSFPSFAPLAFPVPSLFEVLFLEREEIRRHA